MAITFDRKKLLDILVSVRGNVPEAELSDISKYIIFQQGRIHAFNDLAGMTIPFDPEMDDCAADSQLVFEFVRNLPDKDILMGVKDGVLRLQGASRTGEDIVKAEIPLRDDFMYPRELVQEDADTYKRLPETFYTALESVGIACDDDPGASSVIAIKEGYAYARGRLIACRYYLGDEAKELMDETIFVPPSILNYVNRNSPKVYKIQDNWMHLMDENKHILSVRSRHDQHYPFEAVDSMMLEFDAERFMLPAGMKDVLTRCVPFSGHNAKLRRVNITLDRGILTVVAGRSDGSRIMERLTAKKTEGKIRFAVNVGVLGKVIEYADDYICDDGLLVGTAVNFNAAVSLEAINDNR